MKFLNRSLLARWFFRGAALLPWTVLWKISGVVADAPLGRRLVEILISSQRRVRLRQTIQTVLRVCQSQGKNQDSVQAELRLAYLNELLWGVLFCRFASLGGGPGPQWLQVVGENHLEEMLRRRRPFILLGSHLGVGRAIPCWMGLRGVETFSIEAIDMFPWLDIPRPPSLTVRTTTDGFGARLAIEAVRVLRSGGVVHITGDSLHSGSQRSEPQTWHGMQMDVPVTFAKMAIEQSANVISYFCRFERDGRVRLEFRPLLQTGAERKSTGMPADPEAVRELVGQYLRLWQEEADAAPGNIRHPFLKHSPPLAGHPGWVGRAPKQEGKGLPRASSR